MKSIYTFLERTALGSILLCLGSIAYSLLSANGRIALIVLSITTITLGLVTWKYLAEQGEVWERRCFLFALGLFVAVMISQSSKVFWAVMTWNH